jgi:hypothetical protein
MLMFMFIEFVLFVMENDGESSTARVESPSEEREVLRCRFRSE